MGVSVEKRNHVTITGAGPETLLLAHGLGTDQSIWSRFLPSFANTHRIVAFDFAGCGKSPADSYDPVRYGTLDGYASDVLDVCAALDLRRAVFVGHSIGGMVGVLAALAAPERFARLVLIAPAARYLGDPPEYAGAFTREDLDRMLDLMGQNFAGWASHMALANTQDVEVATTLERTFLSGDAARSRRFAEVALSIDLRKALPRVAVPALVLACRHDELIPPSLGEYVHDHLPRSRFELLPGAGHCPQLNYPGEVADAIRRFLAVSDAELTDAR